MGRPGQVLIYINSRHITSYAMSRPPDGLSVEKNNVQISSINFAWVIVRVFRIWHDTDARPSTRRYGARNRDRVRPRPNTNRRYMRRAYDCPPNSPCSS